MTSRELLDKILQSPIIKAAGGCFMKNDELEIIKKDLERLEKLEKDLKVLEILKKWIVVNETYDDLFPYEIKLRDGYVSNKSCLTFTKDDYEKVKEWLEID